MSERDNNSGDDPRQPLPLARAQLDRAAAELDHTIITRLRSARLRAVAAAETRRAPRSGWWLPLSSAAAATVIAVTVALFWWRAPDPTTLTAATDDIELLTANESPDFFSEQLEFYDWLEDEQGAS